MAQRLPRINLMMLGDGSVGKTTLLNSYDDRVFKNDHVRTVGLDNIKKTYKPPGTDETVTVWIWDTAGQERYKLMTY